MFSYLKFFFLGSLILIVTASYIFTAMYKHNVQEILYAQNIQSNEAITKGFINAIYNKKLGFKNIYGPEVEAEPYDQSKIIKQLEGIKEQSERIKQGSYLEIFEDMSRYFNKMPIVAAGYYNLNQELLFYYPYLDDAKSMSVKALREKRLIGLSEQINFKTTQNEVIQDVNYIAPDGSSKLGSILHSVSPVFDENNKAVGAVEIFVEVPNTSGVLDNLQYVAGLFIICLFIILLAGLYWIVRRAEKIIGKQYEVNMELQSAKIAAESENEQKSQFLANISHELRTPLNAIIGFSEIMKDEILGALANPQYKNYVMDIHTQGVHLLSLINDILDFSKAEAGKLDLEYEEIDLNKLIKASMRTQEPRAQSANLELLENLPSKHIVMQTDAKRLKQIMLNLLSNAVKFTPPQGKVTVSVWESALDNKVCIEVADTGIGIAAKDISKALTPFGQVDSELSRRYEGTGLGLPLTKKFIELLGGSMNLESEVGQGTKITVILPKGKVEEMPQGSAPEGSGGKLFDGFQQPKE